MMNWSAYLEEGLEEPIIHKPKVKPVDVKKMVEPAQQIIRAPLTPLELAASLGTLANHLFSNVTLYTGPQGNTMEKLKKRLSW